MVKMFRVILILFRCQDFNSYQVSVRVMASSGGEPADKTENRNPTVSVDGTGSTGRMRLAPLIGAALAVLCVHAARATVLIDGDPGGQIGPYVARYMTIRQSGERVVIDGPCLSACTM